MPIGLGTAVGYLSLDATGFAKGIDSAISDMNRLNNKVNTVSQGLQTIGETFTRSGAVLTAGFTAPVVGFGAASVKAGTEFDTSMSQVAAVAKATEQDLGIIRDRAIEMGEQTRYSATEVSDAMYYMGLAGWDAQQIYAGIPGVLALGAASGEDLARVSDIVTDSLTAFGKSAEDTSEFVNVLAEASRSSNTTVDMLGESFKYVAPVAGAFNYSIQDTATVLGIFANNGIKGSQAGTGLRQALNALINPTDNAAALMDQYGISLFNADGSTKSLMTVCEELRGTFGGLAIDIHNADGEIMTCEEIMEKYGHSLPTTEMEKLTAIVKIFGVRALPGMLSVINAADDDFYGLAEAIYGAQDAYNGLGTVFGMQETMLDNLQGDWYLFTSALGTTKILISDMAKGALRDLVKRFTELINKFNEMDPMQREQIVKWTLIAASIGPVLIVIGKTISGIGKLITTFSTLKSAFSIVGTAIGSLSGDIGAFISLIGENGLMATITGLTGVTSGMIATFAAVSAAIGVLIAAFVNLWKTNEDFRNKIIEIWEGIKAKFEEAGQRIVDIFNELGFNFEDFKELMGAAIEWLKGIWNGFCEFLAPVFTGAFAIIGDVLGGIVDFFTAVIETIAGIIKGFKDGDWTMLWNGISDVVKGAMNVITGILDHLGEAVWNMIQNVANWFGADWNMSWDEAKQAVSDWFNSIIQWIKEIPGKIGNLLSNIWSGIKGFFTSVGEWISTIPGKVSSLISNIGNSISKFVSNVVKWFSQLPGKIATFFSNILKNTIKWGNDMVNKAMEMGANFLSNIVSFFSELPDKIAYYIGYALGSVVKWGKDMVNGAMEMGANFVQAVVDFFSQLPGKILGFITNAWNNIVQWGNNIVNKAMEIGSGFVNNIISFFSQLPGKIQEFVTSALNNVTQWGTDMVNKAMEMGANFLQAIVDFFSQLPEKIHGFITSALDNVTQWGTNMVGKSMEMGQNFLNGVVQFFTQLPSKIQNFLTGAISNVTQWVSNMRQKAVDAARGFINNIVSGFSSLPSKVAEIGANIVSGIWNGIVSGWEWLKGKVSEFAQSLLQGAKDALGIESPSKEFRDKIGKWIPPGIGEGFADAMPALVKDMQREIDNGVDKLSVEDADVGISVQNFADTYTKVFEGLVLWYESMDARLAITVESMRGYLEYLIHVGNMLNDDGSIGGIVVNNTTPKKPVDDDIPKSPTSGTGGDTIIFYSNEPIDEIQAARLLKETKRDMAEGF